MAMEEVNICRFCFDDDTEEAFISPCYCAGSQSYVHETCLIEWIALSKMKYCQICKFQFITDTRIDPFGQWKKLLLSIDVLSVVSCYIVLFVYVYRQDFFWSFLIIFNMSLAFEEMLKVWLTLSTVTVIRNAHEGSSSNMADSPIHQGAVLPNGDAPAAEGGNFQVINDHHIANIPSIKLFLEMSKLMLN